MPQDITDVAVFTAPIVAPADGDPENAASVLTGLQGLANRTAYLNAQIPAQVAELAAELGYQAIALVPFAAGSPTASGATFFTANSWKTNTSFVTANAALLTATPITVEVGDILELSFASSAFVANNTGSPVTCQMQLALEYESNGSAMAVAPGAFTQFTSPPLQTGVQVSFISTISMTGLVVVGAGEAGAFNAYINAWAGSGSSPTNAGLAFGWSLLVKQWRAI